MTSQPINLCFYAYFASATTMIAAVILLLLQAGWLGAGGLVNARMLVPQGPGAFRPCDAPYPLVWWPPQATNVLTSTSLRAQGPT